jgi:hypothetical protein
MDVASPNNNMKKKSNNELSQQGSISFLNLSSDRSNMFKDLICYLEC